MVEQVTGVVFEPKETKEETTTIYCNQVRIGLSVWDVTMDMCQSISTELSQTESGQKVVPLELRVRIIMSPQHAKAFAQVLGENIQQYERDFGEIAIQPKK